MKTFFSGAPTEDVHIEKIGGRNNMFSYFYVRKFLSGRASKDSFMRHVQMFIRKKKRREK